MAFARSRKKVEVEHEIQASKALTIESPFLAKKPTAEGKQKKNFNNLLPI